MSTPAPPTDTCTHGWVTPPECPQCCADERDALKALLEDCRPSIKARIAEMELSDHVYDTGPMEQLLARIEAALEGK